jgi:excisionase family DNA binding protein
MAWYTIPEAAQALRVSESTIRLRILKRTLMARKTGTRY